MDRVVNAHISERKGDFLGRCGSLFPRLWGDGWLPRMEAEGLFHALPLLLSFRIITYSGAEMADCVKAG